MNLPDLNTTTGAIAFGILILGFLLGMWVKERMVQVEKAKADNEKARRLEEQAQNVWNRKDSLHRDAEARAEKAEQRMEKLEAVLSGENDDRLARLAEAFDDLKTKIQKSNQDDHSELDEFFLGAGKTLAYYLTIYPEIRSLVSECSEMLIEARGIHADAVRLSQSVPEIISRQVHLDMVDLVSRLLIAANKRMDLLLRLLNRICDSQNQQATLVAVAYMAVRNGETFTLDDNGALKKRLNCPRGLAAHLLGRSERFAQRAAELEALCLHSD